MLPRNTSNGRANRGLSYAQKVRDLLVSKLARHVKSAGLQNDFGRQDCVGMSISPGRTVLANHVGHVVCVGSEKQMINTHTWWVVASMQNKKAIKDWTVVEFPINAMGRAEARFPVISIRSLPHPKPAVSPWPIAGRLVNLAKEAVNSGISVLVIAVRRAIERGVAGPSNEIVTAGFARSCYFKSSQDVNLQRQVSFWLGSLECSNIPAGHFAF